MSYNCCPKHLQGLLNTLWLIQCLTSKCHLSFSANSWSLTNKACKVQLSSPTIYTEQVHVIPGKTAGGTVAPSSCHVFTVPNTWKKKKYSADVTEDAQAPNPWEAVLAHPLGQYPQNGGSWWFLFHASVTLSLFLGCQRKLIFQISGADVRVTKGEPDGHQRGQRWEWITIQKKKGIRTTINQPKGRRSLRVDCRN